MLFLYGGSYDEMTAFLVASAPVPPGWRVVAKYDEKIVTAEEIPREG